MKIIVSNYYLTINMRSYLNIKQIFLKTLHITLQKISDPV